MAFITKNYPNIKTNKILSSGGACNIQLAFKQTFLSVSYSRTESFGQRMISYICLTLMESRHLSIHSKRTVK